MDACKLIVQLHKHYRTAVHGKVRTQHTRHRLEISPRLFKKDGVIVFHRAGCERSTVFFLERDLRVPFHQPARQPRVDQL